MFSHLKRSIKHVSRFSTQKMALARLIELGDCNGIKKWFEKGNTLEHDSNAITYAACFNLEDITLLLADKGLNIEIRDNTGKTPIEWAAFYSNHSFIKSLLSRGADTAGDSWLGHKAPLHYTLENTWKVLGDIPELERHIETAEILKNSYDKDTNLKFYEHSQTYTDKHLVMLDRIENGLCDRTLLEEMTRFNNTF